jgi:hypothetical protein
MSFRTKEQDIKKLLNDKYIIGLNRSDKFNLKYESSSNKVIINGILELKQSHYEYIREGAKVKPYIDYDGITKENKNEYLIDSQRKLLLLSEDVKQETLSKLLNIFIDSLNILGCNVDLTNILILDGSRIIYDTESKKRYYKISFHLTTTNNKFVFENTKHCKEVLLPILKETEYNLYNNNCFTKGDKPPIDKAVYGKTQKFRTIFSFKNHSNGEKDYILNPINNKCESITVKKPIKYFVQYFKSDYIIIETPLHLINNDMKQDNKHIEYKIKDNNNNNKQLTLNLNYSADIQRRLINTGIKTATINISKNGQYTNYNIMYNPNIDKCIYGNDHERVRRGASVCWAYIKSGCIYARCFGAECKNKEPLKLGYVLENSPLENKQNCIQVNERFLTLDLNNKVNHECKKFIENDSYKALCIKSGTGTGKTYLLNKYIPLYEKLIQKKYKRDLRVLVISTRQSYARSVCNNSLKELNIINYLDYKEDKTRDYEKMGEVNKICVSIETLNHLLFTCRWKPYDVVILDESESISRHIFSDTVKYGSYKAFQLLCKIIKRSKKVFVLDADLNKPSLRLINKIDKSQVLKINNTYINNKKEYYFSKNKKKFIQDIKDDLKNDKKLYIVVLSLTEAVFIENELKATLTEHNKSLLPINSNSGGMTKRQLDNVNKHWIKYDIVITTSTTGAGVDFNPKDENGQTYKHFDKVYGFIQACCSPPTEFLQIIDRVRNPKSYKYNILIDSHINVPTDETFIYTYNQAEYITKQFKLTELTDTVSYSYLDNEEYINNKEVKIERDSDYSSLLYYNYMNTRMNNKTTNYLLMLKLIIESRNNICVIDEEKHKQEKAKKATVEELSQIKISQYTDTDIKSLKNKLDITTQERYILKKNKICNDFKIHKTNRDHEDIKNILEYDITTSKKSKIKLIRQTFIKDEYINKTNLLINEKENSELKDHIKQNILNMYRRLINIIKYDYTPEYKISIENMSNIENEFKYSYGELRSITDKNSDKYIVIQGLLTKYGFVLKKEYDIKKVDKKAKRILKGFVLKPNENIYNGVSLRLEYNSYYDSDLIKLCSNYTKYKYLQEGEKEKQKRLF